MAIIPAVVLMLASAALTPALLANHLPNIPIVGPLS